LNVPASLPASHTARRQGPTLRRGFTLLEMLVVLVIVGLLSGYVAPRFFAQIGRSEIKVAKAQIEAFSKALDQYRLDVGRYPSTEQGLAALVTAPDQSGRWQGPYLSKSLPMDPWGNRYAYFSPGKQGEYEILSYGRDGKPGGQAEDADISTR
jgi:general secretion pathway protein G